MLLSFDQFNIQPIQEKDYWNLCNFAVANEDRLRAFFPLDFSTKSHPRAYQEFFAEKKAKQFLEKDRILVYTIKEKEKKGLVGLVYIKELDWKKTTR